jgi:hypothetical protein
MLRIGRTPLLAIATALLALALPAMASANDYCVKPAPASCDGAVVDSLEIGLDYADDDKNADRVFLGPTVHTAGAWGFTYAREDAPVEIIGSGTGRTILTGPAANSWIVQLRGGPGSSIHDLTVRLPKFAKNGAVGLLTTNTARRVEVIEDDQQAYNREGAIVWRGGTLEDSTVKLDGTSPALNTTAVRLGAGAGTVRGSTLSARTGVHVEGGSGEATIARSRITASENGIRTKLATTNISASLIRLTGDYGVGVLASPEYGFPTTHTVNADGITIVGPSNPDFAGIAATTSDANLENIAVNLRNSVIRGTGPLSAVATGEGAANVTASYSDYDATRILRAGEHAKIDQANVTNVGDPAFVDPGAGDYRLRSGSALLDAGDPASAQGLDLGGNPLVADGNGDGTARRDIGAFELPAAPGGGEPGGGQPGGAGPDADTTAPLVTGFKATPAVFALARASTPASARAPRGTRLRYTVSEPARVTVAIQRKVRRRGHVRHRTVGTLRRGAKVGANSIRLTGRIGKRVLRPGRYRAVLRATDAAGNRSAAKRIGLRITRR